MNNALFALFYKMAEKYPDNIVICNDNSEVSYRSLYTRALKIAGVLGRKKNPVAIICCNLEYAIASMLACLLNQNIFIPISADLPSKRRQAIIDNSGAEIILTDLLVHDVNAINVSTLKPLRGETDHYSGKPAEHNIAYILFTSGTTGTPKGVAQSEIALREHMLHYINSIGVKSGDRIAMVASFGYDAALMDIFAALLSGATLVPLTIMQHTTHELIALIQQQQITIFHSTPSVYRLIFANEKDKSEFKTIRAVVLGGEQARRSDLALFNHSFLPGCILINGFGPSESTLALQGRFNLGDDITQSGLPIGVPVPDMDVELVDVESTSDGDVGEIVLKSPNVFMGYVNRPEDIAALHAAPRNHAHHTGDLGKRLADGRIIHMGRKDLQVKISGIRIELEEINALLVERQGIEDAVTCLVESIQGNARLISWVISTEESWDEHALISALKALLPQTSVPARIIPMVSFPRRPNGKVDTSALPAPCFTESIGDDLDPLSSKIADIWRDTLGLSQAISLSERFLDIGGTSLAAISVISLVQQETRVRVRPSALLRNPTLDEFIAQVKSGVKNAA